MQEQRPGAKNSSDKKRPWLFSCKEKPRTTARGKSGFSADKLMALGIFLSGKPNAFGPPPSCKTALRPSGNFSRVADEIQGQT
jgi:hypothetical protein